MNSRTKTVDVWRIYGYPSDESRLEGATRIEARGFALRVAHGVSLRAVQVIGGWTSLRMVERYAHVDDAELTRAVRITHTHAETATQADTKTGTAAKSAAAVGDTKTDGN